MKHGYQVPAFHRLIAALYAVVAKTAAKSQISVSQPSNRPMSHPPKTVATKNEYWCLGKHVFIRL